uniref:Uncharacterized protein n=1 Tax=Leersia perrieri TaxID=77586 RepID=A0A0D9XF15_9ORYZ
MRAPLAEKMQIPSPRSHAMPRPALAPNRTNKPPCTPPRRPSLPAARIRASPPGDASAAAAEENEKGKQQRRRCLRCGRLYHDGDNSPTACAFHGHITGEKGLFSLSPPHQGIDGEWSDKSGVIVYRWNHKGRRPNTGRDNWKGRWSCCQERDEGAPPCRRGRHVSYDDGFTLF